MSESRYPPGSRAARTREALLSAGLELMAERPVDAIPIDDVVARAGVAKGSFFNHFADKQDFAGAVAAEVRGELESRIGARNRDVADPLERLVGGMSAAVAFALSEQLKAIVMLRGLQWSTARGNPLNKGIRRDIEDAVAAGLVRPEAGSAGVLYWLSLCQMIMVNVIEREMDRTAAAVRLREMLVLGLGGLGVDAGRASQLSQAAATALARDR